MKTIKFLLLITFPIVFIGKLTAQTNSQIDDFVAKVDNSVLELSKNASDIYESKGIWNRKIKLHGKFDNKRDIFKQRIKFFKSGTKKEIIKIKQLGSKKAHLLLKIILINDEYFFIKKISYSSDNKFDMITKEVLIDGKIYIKTDYNKKGETPIKTESWVMRKKKTTT